MRPQSRQVIFALSCLLTAAVRSGAAATYESDESIRQRLGVSHHGGAILDCEPPMFFGEFPARDTKVEAFQTFSLTGSENTEADTLRVWVNNEVTEFATTVERSGRVRIEGKLPKPITTGKVWIKVTGYSHDGCDQLHVWTVYLAQ